MKYERGAGEAPAGGTGGVPKLNSLESLFDKEGLREFVILWVSGLLT
jgi:hypothetical protein